MDRYYNNKEFIKDVRVNDRTASVIIKADSIADCRKEILDSLFYNYNGALQHDPAS